MTITLHAIPETPPPVEGVAETVAPVWFVVQRSNGEWSPAAKILYVFTDEAAAEREALHMKQQHPLQHFGVAMLISEALPAERPFKMVRAT